MKATWNMEYKLRWRERAVRRGHGAPASTGVNFLFQVALHLPSVRRVHHLLRKVDVRLQWCNTYIA